MDLTLAATIPLNAMTASLALDHLPLRPRGTLLVLGDLNLPGAETIARQVNDAGGEATATTAGIGGHGGDGVRDGRQRHIESRTPDTRIARGAFMDVSWSVKQGV
jgi:hypothetical protein